VWVTAVNDWEIKENADFDFSPLDAVRRRTKEDQTYVAQELRLQSAEDAPCELGDGVELRWLAGLFGFTSSSDRSASNEFRPDYLLINPLGTLGIDSTTGDFTDSAFAAFGQATVTVAESWDFTGGFAIDVAVRKEAGTGGYVVTVGEVACIDVTGNDAVRGWFLPTVYEKGVAQPGGRVLVESAPGVMGRGDWMRVRLEYDRTRLRLSVDGVPVGEVQPGATASTRSITSYQPPTRS